MAVQIAGITVNRISVVDDDPGVRDAYAMQIEELNLEPVREGGPLTSLSEFARDAASRTEGAVCDFQLGVKKYAGFDGAELVAEWYGLKFPALLCTRWERASIDELRRFRPRIPVLIRPSELDPERLIAGLSVCIRELQGERVPSRRIWRTLVRVEDVGEERNRFVFVVLPAWSSDNGIRLRLDDIPASIREDVRPGARLYAYANLGAESDEELFFERWEVSR